MTHTHLSMGKKSTKASVSRFPEVWLESKKITLSLVLLRRGTGIKVDSLLFGVEFKKNASNGILTMFKR